MSGWDALIVVGLVIVGVLCVLSAAGFRIPRISRRWRR